MLLTLACFIAAVQAALVKVDADGPPLLVYVNGDYQGETPVILKFDPGRYRLMFKEDQYLDEVMTYTLEVGRQSKGKVTVDWNGDDVRVAWLEDVQQRSPSSRQVEEEDEYDPLEEAERAAMRGGYDEPDDYEDDYRGYDERRDDDLGLDDDYGRQSEEDQRQAALEAARRLLAEEEARQQREAEEEARRADEAKRRAEEERRAEEAARRRAEEERRRAEEEARRRAEEERRLAQEEARRRVEEERRRAAEQARMEAEAEARARAEAAEAKRRAEEEAQRRAEEEARARYLPHREAAVALMKEGDSHRAIAEFRAAREAGDRDERIAKLIQKIEGELCSVELTLVGADHDPAPEIVLVPPAGEPFGPEGSSRGVFRFKDVPATVPLTIKASGVGYGEVEVEVPPVGAHKTGKVTTDLPWRGLATLSLQGFVPGLKVQVRDAMGTRSPTTTGPLKVTAGEVKVILDGPTGRRVLSLDLAQNAIENLSLKEQLPGAVRLVGLPAGTRVDMVIGPPGAVIHGAASDRQTVTQELAGVPIGEDLVFEGLTPGDYKLSLEHPVLGKGEIKFRPVPGDTSEESVLWESFSHATAVRDAREDWEARLAESKKLPLATKLALGGGGATVALAGAATAFGLRAAIKHGDLNDTTADYEAALDEQRAEDAWDLFSTWADQKQDLRSARTLALGGVGLAAAAGGASVTFWFKGRSQRTEVGEWDFWHLSATNLSAPIREAPAVEEPDDEEPAVEEPEDEETAVEDEPAPQNELEEEFGPMLQDLPDPEDFDFSDTEE